MKNYISHSFFCFALLSFSPLTWSQLNVSVSASAAGIFTGQTTTLTATPSTGTHLLKTNQTNRIIHKI
jgi:hypothetical protein